MNKYNLTYNPSILMENKHLTFLNICSESAYQLTEMLLNLAMNLWIRDNGINTKVAFFTHDSVFAKHFIPYI